MWGMNRYEPPPSTNTRAKFAATSPIRLSFQMVAIAHELRNEMDGIFGFSKGMADGT